VIVGETGTGKSLLATLVHIQSPHRSAELQVLNFSILAERAQRIALLGGSTPDLPTTRRSILEIASTAVLKHPAFASPYLQEKLADALATKKLVRPGAKSLQLVLCRPIVTLRSPLGELHRRGKIVTALYSCLRKFEQISIPPLRDRREDLQLLAAHFFRSQLHLRPTAETDVTSNHTLLRNGQLHPALKRFLISKWWPENLFDLNAYLGSLIVRNHPEMFDESDTIELTKVKQLIEQGRETSLQKSLGLIEQFLVDLALKKCNGNRTKAAALLGLSERSVRRLDLLSSHDR
jgi:DNA-binding NtrC family response regulator